MEKTDFEKLSMEAWRPVDEVKTPRMMICADIVRGICRIQDCRKLVEVKLDKLSTAMSEVGRDSFNANPEQMLAYYEDLKVLMSTLSEIENLVK